MLNKIDGVISAKQNKRTQISFRMNLLLGTYHENDDSTQTKLVQITVCLVTFSITIRLHMNTKYTINCLHNNKLKWNTADLHFDPIAHTFNWQMAKCDIKYENCVFRMQIKIEHHFNVSKFYFYGNKERSRTTHWSSCVRTIEQANENKYGTSSTVCARELRNGKPENNI